MFISCPFSLSLQTQKKNIIFRAKIIAQSKTRPNQPKPISLQPQKITPLKSVIALKPIKQQKRSQTHLLTDQIKCSNAPIIITTKIGKCLKSKYYKISKFLCYKRKEKLTTITNKEKLDEVIVIATSFCWWCSHRFMNNKTHKLDSSFSLCANKQKEK
jgi:hypothetical protein